MVLKGRIIVDTVEEKSVNLNLQLSVRRFINIIVTNIKTKIKTS